MNPLSERLFSETDLRNMVAYCAPKTTIYKLVNVKWGTSSIIKNKKLISTNKIKGK